MNWVEIGSDNGLSPGRRQAIILTNDHILSIRPQGIYFNEILFEIEIFSFKEMQLNMSSAPWRPLCPGGEEFRTEGQDAQVRLLHVVIAIVNCCVLIL